MKKIYSLIAIIMAVTLTFSSVGAVFAAEERELTNDEKAAFIVRDEWTGWVRDFTASLSELDKNATAKIYEDMDFYDMQYRFTEKYKKVPEYLDEEGKPTQKLKDMIKEKRKEINKRKTGSEESSSYVMIDWTGVDKHSWMSKLPNNRYLNDINIPGVANAALAYTESQATDGDTTDIQKARSIAQYCRQSNTIYYNMNSGYRALDYGLNFKKRGTSETRATYGYSFDPTGDNFIVAGNMIQQVGTGAGNYAANNGAFVKSELQEIVRFLIDNPTETVVISIRNLSTNEGTLVTLLKELIDKQTFNLRDGDKTTVNLKDFVYTGNTFPKLKDVRKKMVIFSRISALDIGIPMYSSNAYTSLLPSGAVVDGVSMYTENKEFQYTADEKVNITKNSLDIVAAKNIDTSGKKGKNGALIYTEGYKVDNTNTSAIVKVKPSEVATEVNKAIKAYDIPQGKLVGTIMVDFADEAIADKILKTNP